MNFSSEKSMENVLKRNYGGKVRMSDVCVTFNGKLSLLLIFFLYKTLPTDF